MVGTEPRVNLNSVQLFCRFGPSVGNDLLYVTLRGVWDPSVCRDSVTVRVNVPISTLQNGVWSTIPIAASLKSGAQYYLYVGRRGVHRPSEGKYFYLCSSDGSVDLYPDGHLNVAYPRPVDAAFKTFTNFGIDQQQISTLDTVRLASGTNVSQTFKPRR